VIYFYPIIAIYDVIIVLPIAQWVVGIKKYLENFDGESLRIFQFML
jgi:hypothetical protein